MITYKSVKLWYLLYFDISQYLSRNACQGKIMFVVWVVYKLKDKTLVQERSKSLLPLVHCGRRVLSRPAPSARLPVRPYLVTNVQPTILNGSYLVLPLTLDGTLTLLIMRFLFSFSRIQCHFEILWIHKLTCLLELIDRGLPSSGRYFTSNNGDTSIAEKNKSRWLETVI